ncbi:NTP transferase domain-containing protein [Candidatus Poriferisodalis sp.]|uniref:NTP transferase domain-containing protein n=1 Tax=Candidatus Poriferisodalis sp. TaxID=3101277 RepID=UPI003B01B975
MAPDLMTPGSVKPACAAIVLAAGAGTRMDSDLPKPLHPVAGRAMVLRVLDALAGIDAGPIVVVVGHGADQVRAEVGARAPQPDQVVFTTQHEQLGTGDAVRVGLSALGERPAAADVVVLPGDTPLLRTATLAQLASVRRQQGAAASLLTAHLDDPTGYGRIVRAGGMVDIVEQRDASPAQVAINEINAGMYCFDVAKLRQVLPRLRLANAAGEYYLTDAIGLLARSGQSVATVTMSDPTEALGVNDTDQLAACEAVLTSQRRSRGPSGP